MFEEIEPLKDNLCEVNFICFEKNRGDCVHHKNKNKCKYLNQDQYICSNSVAQVQAMSKYLKHIGLDLGSKGFSSDIYSQIQDEVKRAKELFPNQDLSPFQYLAVLVEEVGEVSKELCESIQKQKQIDKNYEVELIQVAVVAVRMIEDFRKMKK